MLKAKLQLNQTTYINHILSFSNSNEMTDSYLYIEYKNMQKRVRIDIVREISVVTKQRPTPRRLSLLLKCLKLIIITERDCSLKYVQVVVFMCGLVQFQQ